MEQKGEYSLKGQLVPYLCHNIDTHIGGLMIVAKHEIIYQEVIRALKERRIRRFYKCITLSGPREDAGQLHGFITRARKGDRAEVLLKPGRGTRHTLTKYRVLQTNAALSLLEAEAVTDEPHQIRAHFAKCGFAVLGDALYGKKAQNKKYGVQLPAIWADRILFDTGKNNPLAYLDGKDIIATRADLPYIDFGTES
jgi:23S rRNA-/tRNA-specific pseudouridylate synthase